MIKKCKVVMCDYCDAIAKIKQYVEYDNTYYECIPEGWREGPTNKTHLCPTCRKLFDSLPTSDIKVTEDDLGLTITVHCKEKSRDYKAYDLKVPTGTNEEQLRMIRKFANETWVDMKERIKKLEDKEELKNGNANDN